MKATDELAQKSKGMIDLYPEINDWTGKNYQMFDDGGVELEVAGTTSTVSDVLSL